MTPLTDWILHDPTKPKILGASVAVMFYVVILTFLFRPPPAEGRDVLLILIGALTSQFTQILQHYFASNSHGKETKEPAKENR